VIDPRSQKTGSSSRGWPCWPGPPAPPRRGGRARRTRCRLSRATTQGPRPRAVAHPARHDL